MILQESEPSIYMSQVCTILIFLVSVCIAAPVPHCGQNMGNAVDRSFFPKDFVFGVAASAMQIEGALHEDGKGPSAVDEFGNNTQGSFNADIADDHYHLYKEDIDILDDLGVEAFKFSIAWTRILPEGRGSVNPEGIRHYNDVIDSLLEKGIQPYVTLYHFDIPLALGNLSNIYEDFAAYAEICFEAFGDRVKHWITINEPSMASAANSTKEQYMRHHKLLLAHAHAVNIYRRSFQSKQMGYIGIDLLSSWYEPLTNTEEDAEAAQRAMDFQLGWSMDPIIFGDYPASMRQAVGDRLPVFTEEETLLIKGSADFVALNHYTSYYTSSTPPFDVNSRLLLDDARVRTTTTKDGIEIGVPLIGVNPFNTTAFEIVPWGLWKILNYTKIHYNNIPVIIGENGMPTNPSLDSTLEDSQRVEYIGSYIGCLYAALRDGANVKGHFVWSFLDGWEWGLNWVYGLYAVDRNTMVRQPKDSALWYKTFLTNKDLASTL